MPTSAGALPRPTPLSSELSTLAGLSAGTVIGPSVAVTGLTLASDRVRPGDLFAGVAGRHTHGADFAAQALNHGAVGVLTDQAGLGSVPADTPVLLVEDVRASLAPLAAQIYGQPSQRLTVLGVTGTSGKTTTTFLIRAGLEAAGLVSGMIGTVATLIGQDSISTGFTTPEAPDLQALLAVMLERSATAVAMEVSSHALALGRVDAIDFDVAGFTNLSQDHLDFHADLEDYYRAKAKLFDGRSRHAVVVIDDAWGQRLAQELTGDLGGASSAGRGPITTISTRGDPSATWCAVDVKIDTDGSTRFRAVGPSGELAAGCRVPGAYNVANALLALAMLDAAGVPPSVAAVAVAAASVPGRMERVEAGQGFLAIVDYSHKPAAVAGALSALRPLTPGRLLIVLGCGGDRDRAKRPVMGEVAARVADVVFITDDNPRSEDPGAIRAAMLAGASSVPAGERAQVHEVPGRSAAIGAAVRAARDGDTVLIAGKGHEVGQEIGGVIEPFDDRVALRRAIEDRR